MLMKCYLLNFIVQQFPFLFVLLILTHYRDAPRHTCYLISVQFTPLLSKRGGPQERTANETVLVEREAGKNRCSDKCILLTNTPIVGNTLFACLRNI